MRGCLLDAGYTPDGVRALLGRSAHDALTRGEPEPAARASRDGDELGTLVRLFLLEDTEPEPAVTAALGDLDPLLAGRILRRTPEGIRAALDVRPYGEGPGDDGEPGADWWVVSDLDSPASRQDREHVTGVGGASLSLAAATVRRPVGSLLDLGTGCGVQALHGSRHAVNVVATDVLPRALALARLSCGLSGVDVDLREGPWFAPVEGERFDQIVSNPPFVPGPERVDYVYRDSGLAGDAALASLLGGLADRLNPGGIAQLLGSWLHVRGEDWPDRVRSWLPDGVDAWVLQREVVDPAMHVGTWQRDAGLVPSSPAARGQAAAWLDWMAAERVEGVGFGFLMLRRTDSTPTVVVEDLPGELGEGLAREMTGWLDRIDWLRAHERDADLLGATLLIAPETVLESASSVDPDGGWSELSTTVRRWGGPGWEHPVDGPAAALLAGCRGHLPLSELVALLSYAHDVPADALVAAALPAVREFVRHGLLLPVDGWPHPVAHRVAAADPAGPVG
ncbi:methyltransferase family protein [Pseudonocardia autotrophica]|uniref:Release factor glutamine methyltransferase n=2 Tax=Pseudonocardia TaxID=1847 RepID=A0A1Y2MJI6_PSEAH|nr:Release factor glutamine methyltransferase [Pseudonocardia autotrophica]TDN72175.1 methyltransferase family protein [Pseudonocardia autotrophica]GEC27655.1 SAM-dependent methyltransferase [Pseudonocardia saturnea]